jgi:thiamine-monophosphate kinase
MTALADQYQVVIVGGDTCASVDKLVVSITLLGEADKNRVVRRNTAKRQDMLCVTGDLGKSAAGMKILRDRRGKAGASKNYPAFMKRADDWQEVIAAHLEPKPRLKEVWALLEICTPSAMIDISDGLSSEVRHLCQGADLGAYLYAERVPVHIDAEKIARFAGMEPLEWALNGGEEYELLFTVPKEQAERVCSHIRASTGTEATVIGEMRPRTDRICLVDKDRRIVPLTIKGYDHFKKS